MAGCGLTAASSASRRGGRVVDDLMTGAPVSSFTSLVHVLVVGMPQGTLDEAGCGSDRSGGPSLSHR